MEPLSGEGESDAGNHYLFGLQYPGDTWDTEKQAPSYNSMAGCVFDW